MSRRWRAQPAPRSRGRQWIPRGDRRARDGRPAVRRHRLHRRRRAGGGRQRAVCQKVSRRPQSDWPPDPRSRRPRRGRRSNQEPWREIVGVVPDLGLSVGDPALAAGFYMPVRDELLYFLAVRTTQRSADARPAAARRGGEHRSAICSSRRSARSRTRGRGGSRVPLRRRDGADGDGRHGPAVVDRRHLRVAVVHGDAPHARDRHSRRARRPSWQVLRSITGGGGGRTSRSAA